MLYHRDTEDTEKCKLFNGNSGHFHERPITNRDSSMIKFFSLFSVPPRPLNLNARFGLAPMTRALA